MQLQPPDRIARRRRSKRAGHNGHRRSNGTATSAVRSPRRARRWGVGDVIDALVEAGLVGLLLFSVLAYGSVEPWAQRIVVCFAVGLGALVALRMALHPAELPAKTWAYLPLALFIALALGQLLPLPEPVLRLLSPEAAQLRNRLVGAESFPAPLSLYPHETASHLRLLLAVAAVFMVVLSTYRRQEQLRRLLIWLALIGSAVALLALAQTLTGATNVYWVGPPGNRGAVGGPFVHYSHYGQFANLCLAPMIGLGLLALHRGKRGDSRQRVWSFLYGLAVLLTVTTVFLSGSRTAMIAMAAGALCLVACVARQRLIRRRIWWSLLVVILLAGATLTLAPETALRRLGTLGSGNSYADRLQILNDLGPYAAKFSLLGSGLGTFAAVFPMFDRSGRTDLATHAENEFGQVLVEMGLVGLLIVVLFLCILAARFARGLRHKDPSVHLLCMGLAFSVTATLVHSTADFGQHLPPNALLMAILCALLVQLGRRSSAGAEGADATGDQPDLKLSRSKVQLNGPRAVLNRTARWGQFAAVLAAGWFLISGASTAAEAQGLAQRAKDLRQALSTGGQEEISGNEDYAAALSMAARSAELEPANVEHQYLLNALRWESISRVREPGGHGLVLTAATQDHARRIVDQLREARKLCPTYGRLYSLSGQLNMFVLGELTGEVTGEAAPDDILIAEQLAPNDPLATMLAARLEAVAGRTEQLPLRLHRAMALGVSYDQVLELCVEVSELELALTLAQGDFQRLSLLAQRLETISGPTDLITQIRDSAAEALATAAARPDAPPGLLSRYADHLRAAGRLEEAVTHYRRAIVLDYASVHSHLALTETLIQAGRGGEAVRAAKAFLLVSPGDERAQSLLEQAESLR